MHGHDLHNETIVPIVASGQIRSSQLLEGSLTRRFESVASVTPHPCSIGLLLFVSGLWSVARPDDLSGDRWSPSI